MTTVQDFILNTSGKQKAILQYLDTIITEHSKITSKIKYKIPFYYLKNWVCYLNPRKDESVDLCFIRGNELADENNVLEFRNRKQVKSIIFFDAKEIPFKIISNILQEAFILDETVPYTFRKK